jgi:hypothetical protein
MLHVYTCNYQDINPGETLAQQRILVLHMAPVKEANVSRCF